MKKFKEISKLAPYVDSAFEEFYQAMLKDSKLTVFFDSNEQIKLLILKQKEQFKKSLTMPLPTLKNSFETLGEIHFDIKIPYIDFIKGIDILEEYFITITHQIDNSVVFINEVFMYFKLIKAYTAKGYLNRMIQEDKKDICMFLDQTDASSTLLPKGIIFEKILWLKEVLEAIEEDREPKTEENRTFFKEWLKSADFLDSEKKQFFENLDSRIVFTSQNLFYFLQKHEYLEILPLYTSLLEIYKLTLILNNALTMEYAKKALDDTKFDSMTKLFRKDSLDEMLKMELSFLKRNKDYKFSLVYLDIDDFKHINDDYGHYLGDKVIEKIGEIINTDIRLSDIGFRIGGDEFALILKNASAKNSNTVCEKILKGINEIDFIFNEQTQFKISLSAGIVEQNNENILNLEELKIQTDNKMYTSKRNGKNQITG